MADETAVIDPPAPAGQDESILKDFGDIDKAMDRVFPATVEKSPDAGTPPSTAAPAEQKPAEQKPAAAEKPVDDLLDVILGEKPAAAPPEKKEYDAPEHIKKDPKAYANWNEVRRSLEESTNLATKLSAENAELKKKVESGVTDETVQARITQLEGENKELSERISNVDLQSHPEFQRRFVQARQSKVENGASIIKDAGQDPAPFVAAMEMTGKAKIEALDEIVEQIQSPTLRSQIGAIVSEVNDLDRQRTLALSNAKANLAALRQQDSAFQHKALEEHKVKVKDSIVRIRDYFANNEKDEKRPQIAFCRPIEGNDKWNAMIEEDDRTAIAIATGNNEGAMLAAARAGVVMPRVYEWGIGLAKEVVALRKENAELKGADPSLNGRRRDTATEEPGSEKLSFAEAAARGSGLR